MTSGTVEPRSTATARGNRAFAIGWLIGFSLLVKLEILSLGALFRQTPYVRHLVADVWVWSKFWEQCLQGKVPGVDFGIEYPVAIPLLYWSFTPLASLAQHNPEGMLLLYAILASLMDVANTALIFCILRDINSRLALPLALTFLLLPTNLILSPVRFETYVIFTVLLGYWCHKKAKPLLATVFWSVGCWMKWFPAFFIAAQEWRALIVERRRWQWLAATAVFLSVAAVLNLPFILVSFAVHGNIDAWSFPYRFHAGRGVSGDTILGVATMWIGELTVARYSGVWTLVLLTAAMFVKPSLRIEYRCVLICISLVLLNRVYSTQFNMWFYPFVLLAAAQETSPRLPRLLALLITLDVTNVLVYPLLFTWTLDEIGRFGPLAAARDGGLWTTAFSVAVILRGVLLVALAAFVLCDVGERERE